MAGANINDHGERKFITQKKRVGLADSQDSNMWILSRVQPTLVLQLDL
jgi:hypothetical protein